MERMSKSIADRPGPDRHDARKHTSVAACREATAATATREIRQGRRCGVAQWSLEKQEYLFACDVCFQFGNLAWCVRVRKSVCNPTHRQLHDETGER